MRALFTFVMLCLATSICFAQTASPTAGDVWKQTADDIVQPYVEKQKNPTSIVVGIVGPNRTEVYSYGKLANGSKPDGNTVFMLGSIQKLFAGVLFGQMITEGKVKLDAPLQNFLPKNVKAPTYQGTEITMEEMATFSSGLPDSTPKFSNAIQKAKKPAQIDQAIYQFLKSYHLTRKPGTQYEYSDISAAMLANLLAQRLGKPFAENVKERILNPLEMTSTGMYFDKESTGRLAHGYNTKTGKKCELPTSNRLSETGSPEMHSTVNDMIKFLKAHLGITKTNFDDAIQTSLVPRFQLKQPEQKSAFFWSVTNGNRYFKNGLLPQYCYSTVMVMDKSAQTGVIVLSNTTDGTIDNFGTKLLTELVSKREVPNQRRN